MQINLADSLGRYVPNRFAERATPILHRCDQLLNGSDDVAVSQRMAMVVFGIRVASAAIAFLSQVFLARWMGGFEYGVFVGVWVAALIVSYTGCLGLPTAVIRFIAKYQELKDLPLLRGVIIGGIAFAVLGCLLVALAGSFALMTFPNWVQPHYTVPILLAAVCLPAMAMQEVQDGVARAFNWPGTALVGTFIVRPALILLFMVLAIGAGYPATAVAAMVATVIATYLATAGQFVSLFGKLRKTVGWGPFRLRPREWLLVAFPIFLAEGFYVLLTSVDVLFVSVMMDPESVAVYFAAVKTLALVHFVYYAVKAATAHRFSAYNTAGDRAKLEDYIRRTVRWTFWPSLGLAIAMMVSGKYFLMLFGENFVEGTGIICVLAIGIIFRASVGPAESMLSMSGHQNACALVYVLTLVFNVILNFALIPEFGLYGAAMATTVAMGFESALLYSVVKRRIGLHMFIVPQSAPPQAHRSAPAE